MAVPIQLVGEHETTHWRQDSYRLEALTIDGDLLRLTVSYTGGCEAHAFDVLVRDITFGRERLEAELSLVHDARGDSCKALIRKELEFSLQPLLRLTRDRRPQPHTLSIQIGGRSLSQPLTDA